MSIRSRILLGFVALIAAGLFVLVRLVVQDVRPHIFGATEDSLAETAVVLAALVESRAAGGELDLADLRATIDAALSRPLAARIYDVEKRKVELRVYVTDAAGRVVYDSDHGRDEGKDYSAWLDVKGAFAKGYGARATRRDPGDTFSAVFYVAVPIRRAGRVAGVLAVGKQAGDVKHFVSTLNQKVVLAGLVALVAAVLLSSALAIWITLPIHRLTGYAQAVGDGRRPPFPDLGTSEIGRLGRAFESMRDALDGRREVEGYVRSLTHETKTPLSAIRAAAELLEEGLPPADRQRFLRNIRTEVERLQSLVDRMLELSALEARRTLTDAVPLELLALAREVAESAAPLLAQKELALRVEVPSLAPVRGDRLLVRQALMNLVQNAIRWTGPGGVITIGAAETASHVELRVADTGPGVPDYALPRVFERFYSVPAADGARSTGLGLPFVREVATLHGGEARLENRPEGGALATLGLARSSTPAP